MKAILSKKSLNDYDDTLIQEYLECIKDIFYTQDIQDLDKFSQHCNTSRLQHSLNVSYYSFILAKRRGLDYKSVARAGILHDFYLYDWREVETEEHHAFHHPKQALKNAKKITEVNDIESDAILNHMWPLAKYPKYKESRLLSSVDKYCTIAEVISQMYKKVKLKFSFKPAIDLE